MLLTGRGAALRYGRLVATDASGRVLRSWLQVVKGHVLIRVADRGAAYPLRIDPMIQQGQKLTGAGAVGTGRFGYAVALSADGDTALIGGNYLSKGAGAAWVFTRSGSTWTQQGGKRTGGGEGGEGEFGTNVALSADGGTALIGAWRDNSGTGAAWAFVNPPTATTGAATGVSDTSATLNGIRGAGGASATHFQYGTTAAYGASTAIRDVGASGGPSPLAAVVDGLAPGTTHHFRLVTESSGGVAYGDDRTLTTPARRTTRSTEPTTPPRWGPARNRRVPLCSTHASPQETA